MLKNRFSKKSSKMLYPLFKPPPKFGEISVIWGRAKTKGFTVLNKVTVKI